jgi:excisionase family DNA binding protein
MIELNPQTEDRLPAAGVPPYWRNPPAISALEPKSELGEPPRTMAIAEAAAALGVSSSTLRRWSQSGRLRVIRTAGGHRRFFEEDVWKLKRDADQSKAPMLRPTRLPNAPITSLVPLLSDEGRALLQRAVFLLYEPGREGWFGSHAGAAHLDAWLTVLRLAAAGSASWDAVIEATDELAVDARRGGAGVTEGLLLFELVGDLMQHRLHELGTPIDSRGAIRRLLRAVGREMVDAR